MYGAGGSATYTQPGSTCRWYENSRAGVQHAAAANHQLCISLICGTAAGTVDTLWHAGCNRALSCHWPRSPGMHSCVGPSQRMYRRCVWMQLPAPSPVCKPVRAPLPPVKKALNGIGLLHVIGLHLTSQPLCIWDVQP